MEQNYTSPYSGEYFGKTFNISKYFGKILNISEYFGKTWNIFEGKKQKKCSILLRNYENFHIHDRVVDDDNPDIFEVKYFLISLS